VTTLELKGLTPPKEVEKQSWPTSVAPKPFKLARPTGDTTLSAIVKAPKGTKLNREAPMRLSVWRLGPKDEVLGVEFKSIPPGTEKASAKFPKSAFGDAVKIRVLATFFPCEEGSEGVCKIAHHAWEMEFDPAAKASETIELPSP
jgi:hypothetical protein